MLNYQRVNWSLGDSLSRLVTVGWSSSVGPRKSHQSRRSEGVVRGPTLMVFNYSIINRAPKLRWNPKFYPIVAVGSDAICILCQHCGFWGSGPLPCPSGPPQHGEIIVAGFQCSRLRRGRRKGTGLCSCCVYPQTEFSRIYIYIYIVI